jgi:hypothetical protein
MKWRPRCRNHELQTDGAVSYNQYPSLPVIHTARRKEQQAGEYHANNFMLRGSKSDASTTSDDHDPRLRIRDIQTDMPALSFANQLMFLPSPAYDFFLNQFIRRPELLEDSPLVTLHRCEQFFEI